MTAITWQQQPLLPAGQIKSHMAEVIFGLPTGLTIKRTLYFTHFL